MSGSSVQARPGGTALVFPGGTYTDATNTTAQRYMASSSRATIAAWLYKAATSDCLGFGFSGDSTFGNRFSGVWYNDGNFYYAVESASSVVSNYVSFALAGTGWAHVALTFDGSLSSSSRLAVWVSGRSRSVTVAGGAFPSALSASLGTFCLGRDNGGTVTSDRIPTGAIDDARVYNRVLTPPEIALLASRRGIGLVPQRQRRTSASSRRLYLQVGGTWKETCPYVNVGGTWKEVAVYRHNGTAFKN
jgi:hypothetical protein